jgi:hypothetical protein
MTESGLQSDGDTAALLSNRRRRYLLYCLHLYANPLALPDIAHQVTVWERPDSQDICLKARLKTYMSLYHDHLPKLAGADVVRYEQDEDLVELGPDADRIRLSLETRLRRDIDDLLSAEGTV